MFYREQIIGIAMVSKCDFDNVTCDWSCSIVRASLKRDLCLKCQLLSFLSCYHLCIFTSVSRQNQPVGGVENLLDIQVSVCYILKHLEDRKASWCDIILIFKLHRRTSFFYTQFENSNDVTPM